MKQALLQIAKSENNLAWKRPPEGTWYHTPGQRRTILEVRPGCSVIPIKFWTALRTRVTSSQAACSMLVHIHCAFAPTLQFLTQISFIVICSRYH